MEKLEKVIMITMRCTNEKMIIIIESYKYKNKLINFFAEKKLKCNMYNIYNEKLFSLLNKVDYNSRKNIGFLLIILFHFFFNYQ